MNKYFRVGIIHAYPSKYILDSFNHAGIKVVFFVPQGVSISHENLEEIVEVTLYDWLTLEDIVTRYHDLKPLNALLPLYEGAVEITSIIAKKIGLFYTDLEAAKASRNKYLSYCCWKNANLPVPHTIPITNTSAIDIAEIIKSQIVYPSVVKLADSMNSQGIIRVNSDSDFSVALNDLELLLNRPENISLQIDRNRNAYGRSAVKFIVQEFCEGPEVSVDVICQNGNYYAVGLFEKAPANGPYFAESMSIYPTSLGKEKDEELYELAINAVKALNCTSGVAHVEMRYAKNSPKILEAGLRPGGAYTVMAVEYLCGINIYLQVAKIFLGLPIDKPVFTHKAALYGGIVYKKSGILRSVAGLEVFQDVEGLIDYKILNQVGEQVFALPFSSQPHFCYYLLGAIERKRVVNRHLDIARKIVLEIIDEN